MDNDPFTAKIERVRGGRLSHHGPIDAAIYVHDTMEIAREAARSLFGDDFAWESVIAIYDRIEAKQSHSKNV